MSDMFADEAEAPGIGHNKEGAGKPIPPTQVEMSEYLGLTYADILKRAADILEKAPQFFTITNDAEDAAATEFMVKVRACWKAAEAARQAEKEPYDTLAGVVHAHFKVNVLDPLALAPSDKRVFDPEARTDLGAGTRVNMAQTIYKTKKADEERKLREAEAARQRAAEAAAAAAAKAADESARKAQREAEEAVLAAARKRNAESKAAAEALVAEARRKAEEAEKVRIATIQAENKAAQERAAAEDAASAKAADLTRNRGTRGGVSSLREYVAFRDMDRDTVDLEMLRPYLTEKAIEQALNGFADANKATVEKHLKSGTQPIKGVTFFMDYRNAGRQ